MIWYGLLFLTPFDSCDSRFYKKEPFTQRPGIFLLKIFLSLSYVNIKMCVETNVLKKKIAFSLGPNLQRFQQNNKMME